jgi:hypothetical protein
LIVWVLAGRAKNLVTVVQGALTDNR